MPGRLSIQGTRFLDGEGRTVLLRGVNAGGRSKLPPFLPFEVAPGSVGDDDAFRGAMTAYVSRVVGWGMNVVRVPFTWEALEPVRGVYNHHHLARYKALCRAFSDAGIHVIADHHQDLIHRMYGGDGFPEFACAGPPLEEPTRTESWFLNYVNLPQVAQSFDRFWQNEDGIQDQLLALFEMLARELKDIPGVLGLEYFNEPAQGTLDAEPWYRDSVVPFYQRCAARVAAVDARFMHVLDISGVDGLQGQTSMPDPGIRNAIFAPHLYTVQSLLGGEYDGDPAPMRDSARAWGALGRQWNVPVIVGEFGFPDTAPVATQRAYLADVYAALDAEQLGATVWEYSDAALEWNEEKLSLVRNGQTRAMVPGVVARPYPRAISGQLQSVSWDGAVLRVSLKDADPAQTTDIWWPGDHITLNVPHTFDTITHVARCKVKGDKEICVSA